MYPMSDKYAPPLPCTIGELGDRGRQVVGYWIDCDDQGVHGEIEGMAWSLDATGHWWWQIDVTGEPTSIAIPDATPCTYRHPAGIAALIDAVRHGAA